MDRITSKIDEMISKKYVDYQYLDYQFQPHRTKIHSGN